MNPVANNTPHVAIACGGTGGHLFPGVAVAEQLIQRGCEVSLLVSPKEVDQQAVKSARGVKVFTLPAVALQRGSRLAFALGFWKSLRAAKKLFRERPPQAALAMGGFTSAPPVLAARSAGAKTFLHESNTIPGRANRWLSSRVDRAFVGFPQTETRLRARALSITGTPVRSEFHLRDRAACRSALKLDPAKSVVLVMGGSQGASSINDMMTAALPLLTQRAPECQFIHLTGPADVSKMKQAYIAHGLTAEVHAFLLEMELALGAANVAISRAGASSLAEIAAVRVPSVLIPFPHAADNHQWHNAKAFADTGAAWLLAQESASPEKMADIIPTLLSGTALSENMQAALMQWHAPKAAEQIAETILLTLAGKPVPVVQRSEGTPAGTLHLKAVA
jgi:UDP-N-acetylglucosamine--N-acetylmuramyl-(pentapeptide) pyrophosphoryl-undecaprenol N-acetylglucosamine transferase